MANEISTLYTETEKRLLPIHERIMEVIFSGPDDLSLAEVLGVLEIIKQELLQSYE